MDPNQSYANAPEEPQPQRTSQDTVYANVVFDGNNYDAPENANANNSTSPLDPAPADNDTSYGNAEFVELAEGTSGEPQKYHQETFVLNSLESDAIKAQKRRKMMYEIEDIPSWYLTIFLGLQHFLLMAGTILSLPLILMPAMCMSKDDPDMGNIISTFLFVSGIITILQSTFGTRLPIVQGGSFTFVVPALAILNTERWRCPTITPDEPYDNETWKMRMRELQGAVMLASLFQIFSGFFGIFGLIMKTITPMTIAPAVITIGLSLLNAATFTASKSWPTSLSTIVMVIVFSQYLRDIKIPIPFTKSKKRPGPLRYPMFQIFPVLLTIVIVWAVCGILTASNPSWFPPGYPSRTDEKINVTYTAPWFRVPYPFQWGPPTFTTGAVVGFLSAVFAGIVESLGEYQAMARIVRAPKPPVHTINRGVMIEGIGLLLCGIFGTGNGTTSYSENTGAMSITKVGSRRVVQTAGFIMMVFSLIGKLGAFFVAVPDPIIGGVLCVTFSMIIAVGISTLQNVDLSSPRNIFILGFSIFFSMAVSNWVSDPKNDGAINFGNANLNFTIKVLFSTAMFIAAITSFILDNTIPGTLEERGLAPKTVSGTSKLGEFGGGDDEDAENITYDLPFGMKLIRRYEFTSWIPISPTFKSSNYAGLFRRKTRTS